MLSAKSAKSERPRLVIVFSSTALGAALPLFLSKLGMDPAHAGATIQVRLGRAEAVGEEAVHSGRGSWT